jgi:nucleoside-diphosphate-sugar epimerase
VKAIARRDLGRVLVTGASGFLGAALVRHLNALGATVVAADVPAAGTAAGGLEICDVTDAGAVAALVARSDVATLFHCGAVSGPMVMADQPAKIVAINTAGATNVLEAARLAGVGRVVFCSSIDVYGSRHSGMVGEDAALDPDTVYGASKAAAEQVLRAFRREHGLDAIALRLAWIYGPGRSTPTSLEAMLRDGLAGRRARIEAHPHETTHYVHVDDAVRSLLCAATVLCTDRAAFNATAGAGLPYAAVVAAARTVLPQLEVDFTGPAPKPGALSGYDQLQAASEIGYAPAVGFAEGVARYVASLGGESRPIP